jgi:hypothetical protein
MNTAGNAGKVEIEKRTIPVDGVVMQIVADIQGRSGIGNELDAIDGADAEDMFWEWQKMVDAAIAAAVAEGRRMAMVEIGNECALEYNMRKYVVVQMDPTIWEELCAARLAALPVSPEVK